MTIIDWVKQRVGTRAAPPALDEPLPSLTLGGLAMPDGLPNVKNPYRQAADAPGRGTVLRVPLPTGGGMPPSRLPNAAASRIGKAESVPQPQGKPPVWAPAKGLRALLALPASNGVAGPSLPPVKGERVVSRVNTLADRGGIKT